MFSLRKSVFASFVLFALLVFSANSLQAMGDGNDWQPITPAELALKEPTVEKDADAEAIFWEVRVDDSSAEELAMNHYIRVKIFTERGREKFSKIDVPFVKGMKVKNLMARVVKPDGSIVELKKEDVFEREIVKASGVKVKAKSFAVPGIEPGVIVEYRYREVIDDAGAMGMRLAFQREIPVQTMSYYYKPYDNKAPNYQSYNTTNVKFVKDKKGYYLAQQQNVPAFKEEPRMPPEDMVRPWVLLQGVRVNFLNVSATSFSYTIKDPSNPLLYWGAVSAERAGLVKLMVKSSDDIKKAAAAVVGGAATPDEKLKKLYEFCQNQIRNTSFDKSLTDESRKNLPRNKSVADVLKNKSGDSREIDLLFGALANALGFETRIAFSGDRSEMFFEPRMTNEYFIHPAAIAVNTGTDWKFFNPGTAYLPYGSLVWYEENAWALLVGEKGTASWVQIPLSGAEKSAAKRTGRFRLLEDGTLEGTVRIEYSGHQSITRKFANDDYSPVRREEILKDEIKETVGAAELSEIAIENATDPAKPFAYAFKVRVPNYSQKTGKRLFLQPNFFEYNSKPLFTASTRKTDIHFEYPWSEHDDIEIELPAGFALENADAPGLTADPQKIGSNDIRLSITTDGKKLIYKRKFHFGGGGNILFPAESYPALKGLFEAFNKADTHSLVLKQNAASGTAKTN